MLRTQGYAVTAAVLEDGADRMARAGVTPAVVGPVAERTMWSPSPTVRRAAHLNPGLMYLQMRRALTRHATALAEGLAPLLTGDAVVVSGLPTARLVPLLQDRGVPARLALMAPLTPHPTGTSAWSHPFTELLPRVVEVPRQRLLWWMTTGLSAALADEVARRLPGATPRPAARATPRPAARATPRTARGATPTAYPPVLATSAALDVSPSPGVHQVGWWADPAPVDPLPPELADHLDRHPGAALLALGSMPSDRPDQLVDRLVEVARRTGRPVVMQIPGARTGARGTVFVVGEVDHRALLPRVVAVAHHGGAGTTHAATAAGLPQVVVPHLGDQAHFARQVHRAGLGPAPLRPVLATARTVADRLEQALADPAYGRRARAAAQLMASEDGLGATAQIVREMAAGAPAG
ncbi:glycosyltransferase [Ornithinimicrobium sp. W1679]|uniref:glycosyltransferase n=1 Tax=Ornithinimicrobium sp. W1679 TaxID=3418770 RepID=UPI003CF762FD